MNAHESSLPIAAVVPLGAGDVDALLAGLVRAWRREGVQVAGLLQESPTGGDACGYQLFDVVTAQRYPISQRLGSESNACCLDTQLLAEAGGVLRHLDPAQVDLVVVNRFGKLESEGQGFAAEMLDLMSQGVPLLTVVQPGNLPAWQAFTGGLATALPDDAAAIRAWVQGLSAHSS